MKKFIISVLGQDKPGIIAVVTKTFFEQGLNIEDVSQTILQNQFSGSFVASGKMDAAPRELEKILIDHTTDFDLHFHVRALSSNSTAWTQCNCEPFVITTRGPDQKGLVAQVAALLAAHNVNITQLQAVFRGGSEPGNNIMIYETDIPLDIDLKVLRQALNDKGRELDLEISIQHKDVFEAINRI